MTTAVDETTVQGIITDVSIKAGATVALTVAPAPQEAPVVKPGIAEPVAPVVRTSAADALLRKHLASVSLKSQQIQPQARPPAPVPVPASAKPTSVADAPLKNPVDAAVFKKPSEIVLEVDPVQRETGRLTDLPNPGEVLAKRKQHNTICCCIDPYINEEESVYAPGNYIREGDVYRHRTHMRRMVVCFNICHTHEYFSQTLIQRAADGRTLNNVTVDELNNINMYFLVKSETCKHKHHDVRRYSNFGRILKFMCTIEGVTSTLRKLACLDNCMDNVNVETLRCERSLYSRRHF
jgi:hypothetical protein